MSTAYPPTHINSIPYYGLSVQVLCQDDYLLHRANITVINLKTNLTIATGVTNVTRFVHFLILANKSIKYTADVV